MRTREIVITRWWPLLLMAYLALFAGCPSSSVKLTDAEVTQKLVGKWRETGDTGGVVTNVFTPNGKYICEGVEPRPGGETKLAITATWKVTGGMLIYTIEQSQPRYYKPGETLEEKVVSIDERQFKYRDVNGKIQTMDRLP